MDSGWLRYSKNLSFEPSVKATLLDKSFAGNILYAIANIMDTDHKY